MRIVILIVDVDNYISASSWIVCADRNGLLNAHPPKSGDTRSTHKAKFKIIELRYVIGETMVDIRKRVEGDRGWLKKIQTHVPGFSGYRKREDIRDADNILRKQLANKILDIRKNLEGCRTVLTENYNTANIEKLGNLIFRFQEVEGKVRHAEHGYTGFSPSIRIEEDELDKLYEYDYSMITNALEIEKSVPPLKEAVTANDNARVATELANVKQKLESFESAFKSRMKVISGTEVV